MSTISPSSQSGALSHLLTWPLRRIRWKIVIPYAFLTVMLAGAGSFLATRLVTGSLTDRFDNQLAETGRVVADAVVRKERDHLETLRNVSYTEGVADAVRKGDENAISGLVAPIAGNDSVERLEVLDASGRRLHTLWLSDPGALFYQELPSDDDPSQWQLVQKVLGGEVDTLGDKYAQVVETSEGFVLYTAGPITDDAGLAGVVLVGTTLASFVNQAQAEALANVTVYDFEGVPLASTFARPDDANSSEARLDISSETVLELIPGTGAVREQRSLWGRSYDLVYGRLEVRDQAVGLYSVGLPSDFVANAGSATRTQIALLFGVGMTAVMAIGLLVAHALTTPILKLLHAARLVAAGDLTVQSGVKSSDEIGALATSFDEMTRRLQRQHTATVRALTSAIDARDPYTLGHSVRVGQLAALIGRQLHLDERTLSRLEIGGYLHDIGKIGIRDAILLKPGRLTPEERRIIQEHPRIGLAILQPVELPEEVIEFVGSHHERLDGSGYPHGASGESVSVVARIAAVADMYDAITSERPYRDPAAPHDALQLLRSEAGQLLDPEIVSALASVMTEWEQRRRNDPELRGFKLPDLEAERLGV